jgi:hypothetical protein
VGNTLFLLGSLWSFYLELLHSEPQEISELQFRSSTRHCFPCRFQHMRLCCRQHEFLPAPICFPILGAIVTLCSHVSLRPKKSCWSFRLSTFSFAFTME